MAFLTYFYLVGGVYINVSKNASMYQKCMYTYHDPKSIRQASQEATRKPFPLLILARMISSGNNEAILGLHQEIASDTILCAFLDEYTSTSTLI